MHRYPHTRNLPIALCSLVLCAGPVAAASVQLLALPTYDLVHDAGRGRIYASVPSRAGARGDRVVAIDPTTGEIGPSITEGGEPKKLALSDDGHYLYVALDATGSVRRVDLVRQQVDLEFSLGLGQSGPLDVGDMQVMPGSPRTVALSRRRRDYSPRFAGVAIYDDAVRRPRLVEGFLGSNVLQFSESPALMYGMDLEGGGGIQWLAIDADGVTIADSIQDYTSTRGFRYAGGRLYTHEGLVFQPATREILGAFPGIGFPATVAVNPDGRRVFFLKPYDSPHIRPRLFVFDEPGFRPRGWLEIAAAADYNQRPSTLIRWGADGVAYRSDADQVVLVRSPLVAGAPAVNLGLRATVDPGVLRVGDPLTYRFAVSNAGFDAATGVVLTHRLPTGITVSAAQASQGACRATDGNLICDLGTLAAGADATVTLRVTTTAAGRIVATAQVAGREEDLDDTDQSAATSAIEVLPACALDVTAAIRVQRGYLRYNPQTRFFTEEIQLRNTSRQPIAAPLTLVLDGLTGARLANAEGLTTCLPPLKSGYVTVPVGADGLLLPDETAVATVTFALAPGRLLFRPRLLAGPGIR